MSIPDNSLLELYLRFYDAEFRAREEIGGSLAPFIGALTLLAAGALYLTSTPLRTDISPVLRGSFWITTTAGVFALVLGIGFVVAALWSRTYNHAPGPGAIEKWRLENIPYHTANPEEKPSLDDRLRLYLCSVVADCASANRAVNRTRSAQAHRAKFATAVTLVLFFLAATCLAWAKESESANMGSQFIFLGASHDGREGERSGAGVQASDSAADKDRVPGKGAVPRGKREGSRATSANHSRKRVTP
jgi:hypothetical protein